MIITICALLEEHAPSDVVRYEVIDDGITRNTLCHALNRDVIPISVKLRDYFRRLYGD